MSGGNSGGRTRGGSGYAAAVWGEHLGAICRDLVTIMYGRIREYATPEGDIRTVNDDALCVL